jgi:DNA-3-methyladenine glycosylase
MKILPASFYQRTDVVAIAKELLGKILITDFDGLLTTGRIVETEAYNGVTDKASHAFAGRRTRRTEVMFGSGGTAYVYLCYGLHHMLNVVTNAKEIPHAVLIRAVEPLSGIETMLKRTEKKIFDSSLAKGPGNVGKAFGIRVAHSGQMLDTSHIRIGDDGFRLPDEDVISTKRIGVDYAAEDALLPYRFLVRGNKYVSGNKTQNTGS